MTGYYDIVLGLIPVALFGISGSLYATGSAVTTAVSIGSLVAVGLVGHALFVNGPVNTDAASEQTAAPSRPQSAPVNAD